MPLISNVNCMVLSDNSYLADSSVLPGKHHLFDGTIGWNWDVLRPHMIEQKQPTCMHIIIYILLFYYFIIYF